MPQSFLKNIQTIENALRYHFKDKELLKQALTHKSHANENPYNADFHNERLEFLGDAVLELIICEYLFNTFTKYTEAELSKIKSYAVKESTIAKAARNLNLGDYLFLGKGEETTGGRQKPSLLSDAFEAILAAIYLDSGFQSAKAFILSVLEKEIKGLVENGIPYDFKTKIQEVVQNLYGLLPRYETHKEEGPDHNKIFEVAIYIKEECFGSGKGRNKKEAAQKAAQKALRKLNVNL